MLGKHSEDSNLAEEALRNILNEEGEELENILGRMQKFNPNITGSNAYFYKRRKELFCQFKQINKQTQLMPCKFH